MVWVIDRGILTNNKINELAKSVEGLDDITGLTKPQIRLLAEQEAIQLGLFDEINLVEFASEDYPNERLIASRNPFIATKNNHQREALLLAVEEKLNQIISATKRDKIALKGKEKIALRVGKIINKYKVNKYYNLAIEENSFNYSRKLDLIAQEIALDGVYVIRTSVKENVMSSQQTVVAYKSLS